MKTIKEVIEDLETVKRLIKSLKEHERFPDPLSEQAHSISYLVDISISSLVDLSSSLTPRQIKILNIPELTIDSPTTDSQMDKNSPVPSDPKVVELDEETQKLLDQYKDT